MTGVPYGSDLKNESDRDVASVWNPISAADGDRHGGDLVVDALKAAGVREIFTLSGGHVFPIYDGCVKAGIPIIDFRHEQTATFAAEGVAKLTRGPGVAVITAGPGVTNAVSGITNAAFNGSPLIVLAGRAPAGRWGTGALQEIDHLPIVDSITKAASTVCAVGDIGRSVTEAIACALRPHRGPVFVDFPLDIIYGPGTAEPCIAPGPTRVEPDPEDVARSAALLAHAERPALVAGSDIWWEGAWHVLRAAVEHLRIPTFANGLGRGCLPADHDLAFSRCRRLLNEADVVAVVGTPLDFRLGYGTFGAAQVIHVVDSVDVRASHVTAAASPSGDLSATLSGWADYRGHVTDHQPWIDRLKDTEAALRAKERTMLESNNEPIHPARVYGELQHLLDRDAVVIGDGGDFVSYAGKLLDSYEPGCWMDPGPFGCLGVGLGYAAAARLVHPARQIVLLLGDGALGFSAMDFDTLVRHRLPVVAIVGNNGIWGLEKHPMRRMYGYDVAADLQPECRYDDIVRTLGGAGETVAKPGDIGPALERAFQAGVPYLVNVITDPAVEYPRSSNLM